VVGYHATRQAGIHLKGKDVLILGGGPIELALISNLKACEVGQIVFSESTEKRSRAARDLFSRIVDPRSENVGEVCRQLIKGKGVDVVYDCAGVQVAMYAALDALTFEGNYVKIAPWENL
jgi:threonine dehydrogenase-like Zn-dependent dehydrogenase